MPYFLLILLSFYFILTLVVVPRFTRGRMRIFLTILIGVSLAVAMVMVFAYVHKQISGPFVLGLVLLSLTVAAYFTLRYFR